MPDPSIQEVKSFAASDLSDLQLSLMIDFIEVAVSENDGPLWVGDCLQNPTLGVFLRDGTDVPCLCAYETELGNWIVLTRDNRVLTFLASEVA